MAAYLALALATLLDSRDLVVRAGVIGMDLVGWAVLVPLALVSTVSGIALSLGTPWGLVRHYWVAVKLWLTLAATVLLVIHMRPADDLAARAVAGGLMGSGARAAQSQLAGDAAAALVVLLFATVLSVFKPRGLTRRERRFRAQRAV